jgi:hypothetical protein
MVTTTAAVGMVETTRLQPMLTILALLSPRQ